MPPLHHLSALVLVLQGLQPYPGQEVGDRLIGQHHAIGHEEQHVIPLATTRQLEDGRPLPDPGMDGIVTHPLT